MRGMTTEWVEVAEDDFAAADLSMRRGSDEPPLTRIVCYHCQQCAEKYLKAFLQEHGIRFERTHDLARLLEDCLSLDSSFGVLDEDLGLLRRYAVAVRYPGAIVNSEMAEDARAAAGRVRASVRAKLGLTDPPIAPPAASP